MCPCGNGEQTAFHILAYNCKMVPSSTKKCYYRVNDEDNLIADEVSILNYSRDPIFIKHSLSIILSNNPPMRSKIVLS